MTFHAVLALTGSGLCVGLAVFALYDNRRSFLHWTFAAGMVAVALMEGFTGLSVQALKRTDMLFWQRLSLLVATAVPGSWLLFTLCFARSNYREILTKWTYVISATVALPLGLVTLGWPVFFTDVLVLGPSFTWNLHLGWTGYTFYLFWLLSCVVILMHLERTLRAYTGSTRWQIKFMTLGLGALFAAQIYTSSQALLFSTVDMATVSINAYAITIADLLIIVSFIRNRQLNVSLYVSPAALQNSITIFVVGVYLLTVGLLTKAINYFGSDVDLPLGAFFVFLALVGLSVALLSDEWRHRAKRFISHHFYRARYDYRKEWTAFTERTATLVNARELYMTVCRMVSETLGVPSVTIWVLEEDGSGRLAIGASTVFSDAAPGPPVLAAQEAADFLQFLCDQQTPVNFTSALDTTMQALPQAQLDYFRSARICYGVALVANQQILGCMTLSERHTKEAFTIEDYELIKTIADQTAAQLLNLQLSQRLIHAKQLETFQTLSAFFVHDLKNLAAKLSLMVDNLPRYYDNPEFRNDALRVISSSVAKMNAMCSRLSLLPKTLEIQRVETDLNDLVQSMLMELHDSLQARLHCDLQPLPKLTVDPEQIQKVLLNLLLNANEALTTGGHIWVTTAQRSGWAVLSVRDNGCGMSPTFIEQSLFHPFRTTKSQGLGIGLFHCRTIVDVHKGRVEVESVEGQGSTFRVLLPLTDMAVP